MDPLTHTLVGATLAATRLGSTTRRATAALVIGANLPDVDILSYIGGGDAALHFRRGWTHGVPALLLLPLILFGLLRLWDRARPRDGPEFTRTENRRLLVLCYLGVWTHPVLDWLNTYGMRWWMPFSDTWYYGDSIFIMDPWLWLVLGCGWLAGRRATPALIVTWAVLSALLLGMVAPRAPAYVPALAIVSAALLLVLLIPPSAKWISGRKAAGAALLISSMYILAMVSLHSVTEARVREELNRTGFETIGDLMVGPLPANPLHWEFVAEHADQYLHGSWAWLRDESIAIDKTRFLAATASPLWPEIQASGQAGGFLHWARFPWLEVEHNDASRRVYVMDARYVRQRTLGFGGTLFELPEPASGE